MKKIEFIVWARYHRRPELLAQHLGATIHFINYGQPGHLSQAFLRYLVQTWQTWRVLSREWPDVIFVQNPPIIAVLVVALFARFNRAGYVIDSHTGAFISPRWRWSVRLHRILSRGALMTIVHNISQEIIVKEWKCPYCVIGFTPGSYPEGEPFPFHGSFNVAVVSTYGDDEPLAIILEAARCMPGVDFYFTGDDHGVAQQIKVNKPENCYFTGYLSYARYIDLLRHADAVMDLTTRNDTLLMGGFEAVSLGTPLITSDWPVLKEYFYMGTIHIPNTVNGVCEGVRRCQLEKVILQKDILILKEELQNDWNRRINELKLILLK